jgi:hypothetical protein
VVSFTPQPLYPWRKSPWTYWIEDCLGSIAYLYNVEKGLLPLPGIEPLFFGCLGHSLVTILTEFIKLFELEVAAEVIMQGQVKILRGLKP